MIALIFYIVSLVIIVLFTVIGKVSMDTFLICLAILLVGFSISYAIHNKK